MTEFVVAMDPDDLDAASTATRWCVTAASPRAAAVVVSERLDWAAYQDGKRDRQSDTRTLTLYVRGGDETWAITVAGAPVRWDYGVRRAKQVAA